MKMSLNSGWVTVLFYVSAVLFFAYCDIIASENVKPLSVAASLAIDKITVNKLSAYLLNKVDNETSIKNDFESQNTSTIIKSINDNAKTIQVADNRTKYIDSQTEKLTKNRRDTQKVKESPLRELRKQINGRDKTRSDAFEKRPETQSDARLEPNYTFPTKLMTYDFGTNYEQNYNKFNNKFRQLNELRKSMKDTGYVLLTGIECTFEKTCIWKWTTDGKDGFQIFPPKNHVMKDPAPLLDADNNTDGHFLLLRLTNNMRHPHNVTSPLFRDATVESCIIEVYLYQSGMENGHFKVVGEAHNHTWVIHEVPGDNSNRWQKYNFKVGKITQTFNIILEIVPSGIYPAFIALDNIRLRDCFTESIGDACTPHQFRCRTTNECINNTKICDITVDCEFGEDEYQNCDKMPLGARCTFEDDWCGWHNVENQVLQWSRHNGSTPTNKTGPNVDHTYGNSTGKYLFVNMANPSPFASSAAINSIIFNPPPRVHGNSSSRFYNTCTIRFFFHQYGFHKSGISLLVTELKPKENITTEIWWSHEDYDDVWIRRVVILPNITHKYFLKFEARKGIRSLSDVAIDDLSLSPECFGLNIPPSELNGYNYWNPPRIEPINIEPNKFFINKTYYEFSTCHVKGPEGPSNDDCKRAYNNTSMQVKVLKITGLMGVQRWISPQEGYYTVILFGASGGKGSSGMGSSRGAMIRTVLELHKGQELLMLVGQEGSNACIKSLGAISTADSSCMTFDSHRTNLTGVRGVLNTFLMDGGGGGGGGTFVFKRNQTGQPIPLAIAAGGGGLGVGRFQDTGLQHGQAINMSRLPVTGNMYGPLSSGAGGGWDMFRGLVPPGLETRMGQSLLAGGRGGQACYRSTDGRGNGGFGGGGGGCTAGGGGGGYAGGNAPHNTNNNTNNNGGGGYSFIDPILTIPRFSMARSGQHAGSGMVIIIPAVEGCECDYRCLAMDVHRSQVVCVCPKGWILGQNGKSCIAEASDDDFYPKTMIIVLLVIIIILIIGFGTLCITLYNRYQQRSSGVFRRKMLSGPDLQLNRLRVASDSMMTEYNPNYEFGGVVYTLKDLKDIPRDQLRLVKALGQGAFGEVYQGFYRQRSGDAVEMPVAVKTLPEMSTNQAEMDFLMEALIMSKFNHPNIVHFIGVCFDKHPRFIVLELLAGGDLKNFLRESRPKPERGSSLTMKDLVFISIDVAKGCKYMEDNRFIHRDIAARNCLLTTKGPGRVVKIADFGMSRDIYRSDYYRKGGKAMLPIKWMPPEAFLDGIFTSKTDVWSFGVLLWEIMSMGYMPYTGCANRDVMALVTSGGRLEPPANCPGPLYAIMTQCWHPNPEQRPNFGLILERLGYCAQDPQVMNASLPVFNRPPSNERDTTVMRPENSDESYLKVPHTTDYLIPTTHHPSELQNSVSTSSVDKLIGNEPDNWETSFVMPHSKSTQPLLPEGEHGTEETNTSTDKLIGVDTPPTSTVHTTMSNNINSNHNNNKKNDNLKTGLSLDACMLAKQNMTQANNVTQKKPYVNVNTGSEPTTGNGVIPNGPYSIQNQTNTVYMNNNAKLNNDSEINC